VKELQDYSGDLKPDLKFEDFSKEALVKLISAYTRIYVGYIGMVNTINRKRMSLKEAFEFDYEVYKPMAQVFEYPLIAEAMNIRGRDVVSMLKVFQMVPDGNHGVLYKVDYDVKSQDHVIVTFTACPTLAYFERHGLDESIQCCCGVNGVEERCFKEYARIMSPKIRCKGLKYAPRKSPQDIACKWEFWTEK
jgi:hypothetical protein